MRSQKIICAAFLVVWGISFFLPAMRAESMGSGPVMHPGWGLAVLSIGFYWVPYYGQLWLANILMLLSPFLLKRVGCGKGRVFTTLLVVFAVLALAFPFFPRADFVEAFKGLAVGFYLWAASLTGMAALYVDGIFSRAQPDPRNMWRRDTARAALMFFLVLWAISFFLPAFDTYYWSEYHHVSGIGALGHSILMGIGGIVVLGVGDRNMRTLSDAASFLLMGTLWLANVLMLASPFMLRRIEQRTAKGGAFASLLLLFSLETAAFFALTRHADDPKFQFGCYVWAASLWSTSILFLALRLASRTPAAKALAPHP